MTLRGGCWRGCAKEEQDLMTALIPGGEETEGGDGQSWGAACRAPQKCTGDVSGQTGQQEGGQAFTHPAGARHLPCTVPLTLTPGQKHTALTPILQESKLRLQTTLPERGRAWPCTREKPILHWRERALLPHYREEWPRGKSEHPAAAPASSRALPGHPTPPPSSHPPKSSLSGPHPFPSHHFLRIKSSLTCAPS